MGKIIIYRAIWVQQLLLGFYKNKREERVSGLIYVNEMPKIPFETKVLAEEPWQQKLKMTNCIRRRMGAGQREYLNL